MKLIFRALTKPKSCPGEVNGTLDFSYWKPKSSANLNGYKNRNLVTKIINKPESLIFVKGVNSANSKSFWTACKPFYVSDK